MNDQLIVKYSAAAVGETVFWGTAVQKFWVRGRAKRYSLYHPPPHCSKMSMHADTVFALLSNVCCSILGMICSIAKTGVISEHHSLRERNFEIFCCCRHFELARVFHCRLVELQLFQLLLLLMFVRERERLVECYATFFENQCGPSARRVILPLLRMHYSFDFLPPCGVASLASAADATPPASGVKGPGQPHAQPSVSNQHSPPGSAADANCPCAVASPVPPPTVVAQPTTRSTRSLHVAVATVAPLLEPLPSRSGASMTSAGRSLLPAALFSVLILVSQLTWPNGDGDVCCRQTVTRIFDRRYYLSAADATTCSEMRDVNGKFPRR
jgi:hypothetical protein